MPNQVQSGTYLSTLLSRHKSESRLAKVAADHAGGIGYNFLADPIFIISFTYDFDF